MYVTLTAVWKFFHYSPKRAESLKAIQQVLDLPELRIAKPSDTSWLAHERCVRAVKECYGAIVAALNVIYCNSDEPEALGLAKALSKKSTIAAIYVLDYVLLQVGKLSRMLQTQSLYQSVIPSLVDASLSSLDYAVFPSANWVLELIDNHGHLQEATRSSVTVADITLFQEKAGKLFLSLLKEIISSRFASSSVSDMSIFDPRKVPGADSPDLPLYGEQAIRTLLAQYGTDKPTETSNGEKVAKAAIVTSDIITEWKTYRQLLAKKPKDNMSSELKELTDNEMTRTLFPNLCKKAQISLSIPVTTASIESFSTDEANQDMIAQQFNRQKPYENSN